MNGLEGWAWLLVAVVDHYEYNSVYSAGDENCRNPIVVPKLNLFILLVQLLMMMIQLHSTGNRLSSHMQCNS